jgi:hypothetical protein
VAANENGGRVKALQLVAAIIGTILVSILGAFYVFGAAQAEQLVRLEQSEAEDARQRQVDQALISTLNTALLTAQAKLGALETRISVLESRLDIQGGEP